MLLYGILVFEEFVCWECANVLEKNKQWAIIRKLVVKKIAIAEGCLHIICGRSLERRSMVYVGSFETVRACGGCCAAGSLHACIGYGCLL